MCIVGAIPTEFGHGHHALLCKVHPWWSNFALCDLLSYRYHTCNSILSQASSICIQNLRPARLSYSTWISHPFLAWPSPPPSTPTTQTILLQPKSLPLKMTAPQMVLPHPKRTMRETTHFILAGHWDFHSPCLCSKREMTVNFQIELEKKFPPVDWLWGPYTVQFFSEIANLLDSQTLPSSKCLQNQKLSADCEEIIDIIYLYIKPDNVF